MRIARVLGKLFYYVTYPLRLVFVLIALLFIDDDDFPPIIRDQDEEYPREAPDEEKRLK